MLCHFLFHFLKQVWILFLLYLIVSYSPTIILLTAVLSVYYNSIIIYCVCEVGMLEEIKYIVTLIENTGHRQNLTAG